MTDAEPPDFEPPDGSEVGYFVIFMALSILAWGAFLWLIGAW